MVDPIQPKSEIATSHFCGGRLIGSSLFPQPAPCVRSSCFSLPPLSPAKSATISHFIGSANRSCSLLPPLPPHSDLDTRASASATPNVPLHRHPIHQTPPLDASLVQRNYYHLHLRHISPLQSIGTGIAKWFTAAASSALHFLRGHAPFHSHNNPPPPHSCVP